MHYIDQAAGSVCKGACNIYKAVAVIIGGGQGLRHVDSVVKEPRGRPERPVAVAQHDSGAIPVTKRNGQILERVAVVISDCNIVACREEVTAGNEEDGRLLVERAVTHAKQDIKSRVFGANSQVLYSIAIEISCPHFMRTCSHLDLPGRLKGAVTITEHHGDGSRRGTGRGEAGDTMCYGYVQVAVIVQIGGDEGG